MILCFVIIKVFHVKDLSLSLRFLPNLTFHAVKTGMKSSKNRADERLD